MLAIADPELDHGPRTDKSATVRMCVVSRKVRPVGELIRFVVAPSGEVIPDLKRKLPGRGLWISASRQAVADAVRRHHFRRGFKRDVRVGAEFAQETEALLERFAMDALAMAAKAGHVVAGFGKVSDALAGKGEGLIRALIHASDAASDGIRKLDAIARQNGRDRGKSAEIPVLNALTSEQLDLALGRSNVIHAAVLAGPASDTFLSRSQLLVRYRMADEDGTAANDAAEKLPIQTRADTHD